MIERVIAIPRNGYINRLQAWASSAILAEQLGAHLSVLWEQEDIATTPAEALFSAELLERTFIDGEDVESVLGTPHEVIPRYLTIDEQRQVVRLAGHDRGEQSFMNDLQSIIREGGSQSILVIIAGGKFRLPGTLDFDARRRDFYRSLIWSDEIEQRTEFASSSHHRFLGLHVRETDRSIDAPSQRDIARGLLKLKRDAPDESLFICADTSDARHRWMQVSADLGYSPWRSQEVKFDRSSPLNGVSALVDWRLLTMATGVIHPDASTFSSEAVVAAGSNRESIALRPHPVRRFGRALLSPIR